MNKSGDIRIIDEDLGLSKQFELDLSSTRGRNKNLIKLIKVFESTNKNILVFCRKKIFIDNLGWVDFGISH